MFGLTDLAGTRKLAPPSGGVPLSPTNLVATAVSDTVIRLTWVTPNDNTIDVSVERSLDNVTWTSLGSVNSVVLAVLDTSLTPETEYHYRLHAHNQAGYSAYTNSVSATTEATPSPNASELPSRSGRRIILTSSMPPRR
jgi:hypothetical protein